MSDIENTINVTESSTENEETGTPPIREELPIEQQKKAINLQDLVFVRQYIDGRMENDVPGIVRDTLGADYYDKTEVDEGFYKRTDTVDNAAHAGNADVAENANHATVADSATYAETAGTAANSTRVNNLEITQDVNGVLKIGDIIIPQKKPVENATGISLSVTSTAESEDILLELPANIVLKENAHYKIIGTWKAAYFTTYIDHILYTNTKNYNSHSMNVIAAFTASDAYDFVNVTTSLAVTEDGVQRIRFHIANELVSEKFEANNVITITDIYEIIE